MFEKLEFPRQGEGQAAIMFNRSEYNDESQYVEGEEQVEKSEAVTVPDEKPVEDTIKLNIKFYPGEQGHFHNIDPAMKFYPVKFHPDQKKEDAIQGKGHNIEHIKLYPGDRIMIKCIPDMLHKGEWITIVGENKKYEDYYDCLENTCFWSINHLDTSTLVRAGEQKQQAIEPQVGDIVEWGGSQEKYVVLITEFFKDVYFKSGITYYKKEYIKRILYRLGEDYIEKAPGIGVNK